MRLGLCIVALILGVSACALGDGTPWHRKVTVDYRNLAVADALKDLESKAGAAISFPEEMVRGLGLVNYAATNQEAGRALTRILRPRGLNIRPSGDGSVILYRLDTFDEFKVKREGPFEFAQKPTVTREGDKVAISFETRAFCDVTVAIEDANEKIVRHLASGVLGDNAPEPFQWNSKSQEVVWDGKNDKGEYVRDKESCSVRVSLGVKPRFERTLFWDPRKRWSEWHLPIQATPEGVYVFDNGDGVAQLQLYDRQGNYVRTVYPFPAARLSEVKGLAYYPAPQLPEPVPLMRGHLQATFLSSGSAALVRDNGVGVNRGDSGPSYAAGALAVHGQRIALCYWTLNRLASDGSTGGWSLHGPDLSQSVMVR